MICSTVLADAISTWGKEAQIDIAIEELAELISALMQNRRGRAVPGEVYGEIADASIVLDQLFLIFGEENIREYRQAKLERLKRRIDEVKAASK